MHVFLKKIKIFIYIIYIYTSWIHCTEILQEYIISLISPVGEKKTTLWFESWNADHIFILKTM